MRKTDSNSTSQNEKQIERRALGASGIKVPSMGIGTHAWGLEPFGYGKTYTRDDLFAAYKACVDAGLNFFDTSESYAKGLCEQLLGDFHEEDGRPIVVATKFTPAKLYDPSLRFSHKDIMKELDGSLKRLRVKTVDLYQLHYPVARRKLDKYLDAMAEAVKTGKAKAVGVSNFGTDLMKYAHDYLGRQGVVLASNQCAYSLLHRQPEYDGTFKACKELNIAFIPLLPLCEGILTGKYRSDKVPYPSHVLPLVYAIQLLASDAPFFDRMFTKPLALQRERLEPLFEAMEEVARSHQSNLAQVAINWLIASQPFVIPIPGVKNLKQASENVATVQWKMTPEEFKSLAKAGEAI